MVINIRSRYQRSTWWST